MAANKDVIILIKDENRRSFTVDDVPDSDTDIFYTEVVAKLRDLRDAGVIEELAELRDPQNNNVVRVDIGGIDLDKL